MQRGREDGWCTLGSQNKCAWEMLESGVADCLPRWKKKAEESYFQGGELSGTLDTDKPRQKRPGCRTPDPTAPGLPFVVSEIGGLWQRPDTLRMVGEPTGTSLGRASFAIIAATRAPVIERAARMRSNHVRETKGLKFAGNSRKKANLVSGLLSLSSK